MTRLLHVGDIHFGPPCVPAQVEALEAAIAADRPDAVVVSGDLTQRAFAGQFRQAAAFLKRVRSLAPVHVIPGNHDTRWWFAPLSLGRVEALHGAYRRWISKDLEPVLDVPGARIVGLNSSHGIRWFTLTARLRDLSVVGAIRPAQWARARAVFATSPAGACRILVFHHNLLRGQLSNRFGLAARAQANAAVAATGAELVLNGHDHEERVERVEVGGRAFVVCHANTVSNRVRGGRPASFFRIETAPSAITVESHRWEAASGRFAPAARWHFVR